MRRMRVLVGSVLCVIAALGGCGGDDGSGDAAPAEIVPGDAVIYVEAEVDPSGEQEEAVHAIVERFPGEGEPGERLAGLVDQALRESDTELEYSDDVEPWLGDSVGGYLSSIGPGRADGAVVLATEDADKARDALEKLVEGDESEHEGVQVRADGDTAGAIVEGFLVVGSEAGVEAAIDASKGDSLEEAERYGDAIEGLPEERLATFYVDGAKIAQVQGPSSGVFGFAREAFAGSLDVEADSIVAESVLSGDVAAFSSGLFAAPTPLVGELPADSWYAAGQPRFGEALGTALGTGGAFGGGGPLGRQLERQTGLDLQRDLLGWMGDLGVFARGTSEADLEIAAIVRVTDAAGARRGLGRVEDAIRRLGEGVRVRPLDAPGGGEGFTLAGAGLPKPIHAVLRGERFVIAYGDGAVRDAFDPPKRLADEPRFSEAVSGLGEGYEAANFVDVAPLLALVESFAGADQEYQRAKPYLTPFLYLVGGGKREGEGLRSKMRIQLR